eukprot:3904960-Alexandrium_andersonii.AAC.1
MGHPLAAEARAGQQGLGQNWLHCPWWPNAPLRTPGWSRPCPCGDSLGPQSGPPSSPHRWRSAPGSRPS